MKKAFVFLADGFEEIEAITIIDMLRRAGISTQTVSITDNNEVTGAHQITVQADTLISQISTEQAKALILPGGMPGSTNLKNCDLLTTLLQTQNQNEGCIAAICAAPTVLAHAGILKNKNVTCYPGFEDQLEGANHKTHTVVIDQNIITSRGPATAAAFAHALIEFLSNKDRADEVAHGMLLI